MVDREIFFVHVTTDKLLRIVLRDNESYDMYEERRRKHANRLSLFRMIESGEYEIIPNEDKPLIDMNWFRRMTFAYTFPHRHEGDFEHVAWAFSRQHDGDLFRKDKGRAMSSGRLTAYLDEGRRSKVRDDYNHISEAVYYADSASVDQLDLDEFFYLPEKFVNTVKTQRDIYYRKQAALGLSPPPKFDELIDEIPIDGIPNDKLPEIRAVI